MRLFSFGVGFDVNSRLLDKLVEQNFGQSAYVRPDEDIEQHVGRLANRIETPVLTGVEVAFDVEGRRVEDGTVTNRTYPRNAVDLFAGEQLLMVGRYSQPGEAKVVLRGEINGESKSYDFPASLVRHSTDESHAYVEQLWAVRRVGEIIDEIDLHGKNEELTNELLALSQKHGILTPYTSFLAEEQVTDEARERLVRRAGRQLNELSLESGRVAFQQREFKSRLRRSNRSLAAQPQSVPLADADGFGIAGGAVSSADLANRLTLVGAKTFYFREDRWVDSAAINTDLQQARKIERFSKEFFELAEKHGKRVTKYLAMEGPVVFELDGQTYSIVDPS